MTSELDDTLSVDSAPVVPASPGAGAVDFGETVVADGAYPVPPTAVPEGALSDKLLDAPLDKPLDELLDESQPDEQGPTTQVYGFRIGSSRIVLLDAIAYIGRRPSVPRVVRGGLARLVRVESPTDEVSSTHLELRQLGRTVVAQDLHSTNGTRIGQPGRPGRSLRPGESVVVSVGSLVDIGDGNVIEIVNPQEIP